MKKIAAILVFGCLTACSSSPNGSSSSAGAASSNSTSASSASASASTASASSSGKVSSTGSAAVAGSSGANSTGSNTLSTGSSGSSGSGSNGQTGSASASTTTGGLGSCTPAPGFEGNTLGIGAYCDSTTACPAGKGLTCGAQVGFDFCTSLSCKADADCGQDACCYPYSGLHVCVPTGCGFCPAGTSTSTTGSSGSTGGTTGTAIPVLDAGSGAITGLPANQWTWLDFNDAYCRDGSNTGLAINYNPNATQLMIFLMGGGACFNVDTCAENPSSFALSDFLSQVGDVSDGGQAPGIFDRLDSANPVADWSYVFVPYCTGDVHAGNNPTGNVTGVGAQKFVGYTNMQTFLARLVPTFPGLTQVLLTGASAGGFGAAANYTQVARAFGSISVDMIDDSGPLMRDPYLASCLQTATDTLWGLSSTLLADCGNACPDSSNYFLDYSKFVASSYPSQTFGMMDSTDDDTITAFFGFGADNCANINALAAPTPLTATQFDAGLEDIRAGMKAETNFGTFYFAGTRHTSLGDSSFDTQSVPLTDGGAISMTSWVQSMISGNAINVGP